MSSIDSEFSTQKVKKNFTDMKLENEVDVSAARAWLNDEFPAIEKHFVKTPDGEKTEWLKYNFEARKETLNKCLEDMKSHRSQMVELLVLLDLTYKDASLVLGQFIKYFEYCSQTLRELPNLKRNDQIVIIPESVQLQFLAQPLLYSLYQGFKVMIELPHLSPFIPFMVFLAKSFENSGLPQDTILTTKNESVDYQISFDDWFHPMVISHDADFTSAVESLKNVFCSFQGKLSYCPTHVYIQEPIRETVFSCIMDQFERIKHGDRFDMYTEIEDFKDNEKTEADNSSLCDLPVFSPLRGLPFRIYKFWNPMEMDSLVPKPISGSVILLSYRTDDELISLMKKNPPPSTMSIWSESLPTLKRISSYCRTPVVWFNSLGLFDEKISYDSLDCLSQTKVKMDLYSVFSKKVEDECDIDLQPEEYQFTGRSNSRDINAVVNLARQAFLNSQKLTDQTRWSILKNMKKLPLHDKFQFTRKISSIQQKLVRNKSRKWVDVEGVKVIKERTPVGILVVQVCNDSFCFHDATLQILFSALAYGNSVIIVSEDEQHCSCVSELLDNPQLTGGSIFSLSSERCDSVLQAVRRVQPVVRHIQIGFSKPSGFLSLSSPVYQVPFNLGLLCDLKFLHHLTTYQQCKWVPSL